MKKYIIVLILIVLIDVSTAIAQGVGNHKRYEIFARIAKPLPAYITNNLTVIQTSITKIKNASQKIKGYEETNYLNIDNTNANYLEIRASLAVPYPLPQAYLNEQTTYENFLSNISPLCMATGTGFYIKKIQSHICNNGLTPSIPCSGATDY